MKWLSEKYVNMPAVQGNIVQLYLYKIAYPLSTLFVKLNITPNTITLFSIIFSVFSFLSLILDNGYIYFFVFWALSIHLDYCDGTVARMTGNIRKSAFRLDHMTDILKTGLIILGVGIRYQTLNIWVLSCMAIFSFLYLTLINHDLDSYNKIQDSLSLAEHSPNLDSNKENNFIVLWVKNSFFLSNIYSFFFTLNAHTTIWFFLFSLGRGPSKILLLYFILLSSFRAIKTIKLLSILPKI